MSHPIADLLKRALMVGAREVRLVPGRRTIVVVPQGESEVKGDPQTADKIQSLLAPIITPAARQHLAAGFAEWDFDLDGRGPVRVCAEMKVGMVHVSLFLDRCETLAQQADRGPRVPAPAALPMPAMPMPAMPPLAGGGMVGKSGIDTDDELAIPAKAPFHSPALQTQPPIETSKLAYDNALAEQAARAKRLRFAHLHGRDADDARRR
jgi:hypothetical protein